MLPGLGPIQTRQWGLPRDRKRRGLSPSCVSETILSLEQQLGIPLLTRTTRA
ncbi:helix-turn-helix domain-containing protein [Rhizobium sp. 768_B6_N1_8]|uniref:helix-turn-helix domain-containing protein n=1 Tax=unclassified Rhizobium TaxID=2613769 RepID=UPI003F1E6497